MFYKLNKADIELDAFKYQGEHYKMFVGRLVNETLWCETETFDFQSETRPRPSHIFTRPRRLKLRLETETSRPRLHPCNAQQINTATQRAASGQSTQECTNIIYILT